ncbi:MAG TPA: hypothetical protein VKH37_02615, partial [Ferruginibacter sp.]|nr:hypothetical protein [Ferruginibacter sp.]
LDGEINAKEGSYPRAIELLNEAVAKEDQLNYDEPPDWFFSTRHHLGAILIDAGKYDDAIQTYDDDLKNFPENGWALAGLMNAYRQKNDQKLFDATKVRFEKAWHFADIKISSSRIL